MAYNDNLSKVRANPNDELYTFYNTIEKEMNHYQQDKFFKDKIIYLNCDDANFSQFWWYFYSQCTKLKYKELHATCYHENSNGEHWYFIPSDNMYSKDNLRTELKRRSKLETNIIVCEMFDSVVHETLNGNGSFDSDECLEILERSDVVITNPPFSLFKTFVPLIINKGKFLITIGPIDAISYKEIFPLIKANFLWKGYEKEAKEFVKPNGDIQCFGNITWFTNVPTRKRLEYYRTYDMYNPSEEHINHVKYDYYDAIECCWRKDKNSKPTKTIIPCNYTGAMAVPVSFLDNINPNQFEIISSKEVANTDRLKNKNTDLIKDADAAINGKPTFGRILIRWKPEAMPTIIDGKFPEYNY